MVYKYAYIEDLDDLLYDNVEYHYDLLKNAGYIRFEFDHRGNLRVDRTVYKHRSFGYIDNNIAYIDLYLTNCTSIKKLEEKLRKLDIVNQVRIIDTTPKELKKFNKVNY